MKLTNKQKRQIASGIPKKYDYMDSLPMKGWAWEFLRRDKKYIETFISLEKAVKSGVWNNRCDKILSKLKRATSPTGLLIGRTSTKVNTAGRGNFLILKLPPYKGDKAVLNKFFGSNHHTVVVPRPEKRYCDFPKKYCSFATTPLFRPQIPDYRIYKTFSTLLNSQQTLGFSPDTSTTIEKPILDRSDEDEDIFYVAVSKNAKHAYLKEYMLADIAKILKKHKPRAIKNEWKHYLIVYDLKQMFISYDDIGDILRDAYPEEERKNFTETKNINNWYLNATSLIDGGFIKYIKK